jgi:hypothetical protein
MIVVISTLDTGAIGLVVTLGSAGAMLAVRFAIDLRWRAWRMPAKKKGGSGRGC